MEWMAKLIVFLPLLGAMYIGLRSRVATDKEAQIVTSGLLVLAAVFSGIIFLKLVMGAEPFKVTLAEWIHSGDLKADWVLRVDMLTAVMLVVVTWVSSVVHIYSVGYMHEDEHKPRFMAYLSLFTFFMLMLVTADNFIQIFLGWEGVGLASYLLIGFWYKKPEANAAAMKAFLVNRVGDIGLALGIALILMTFGSVQFDAVFGLGIGKRFDSVEFLGHAWPLMDVICVLLFIGAMGKSAQLLLHTWLPDAMEGPTPVSALIHAATMVTAGVFLVARCSPLFEYAPFALQMVTVIGGATALFAATIGLVQNDIKRVIAYSTCSQLGYMFFACGVSAYSAGVFHLMTHAFFKALLFLGAGSVIHAMHHEQDMRNMGGIRKLIPVTYILMWIGSLALAGIPPFAGYYSKDLILEVAYAAHSRVGDFAFVMGAVAAFLTAFYSFRLIFMTFHGEPRADHHTMEHVHESPKVMILPLFLLAGGAILAGYAGVKGLGMVDPSGGFWKGAIFVLPERDILEKAHHVPGWVKWLPVGLAVLGIVLAYIFYVKNPNIPVRIAVSLKSIYTFLLNKWYFDELYDAVFVQNAKRIGTFFWKVGDIKIIDGLGPNGAAWLALRGAIATARTQSGYLYHYAFAMMIGLLLLVSWLTYILLGGGQ